MCDVIYEIFEWVALGIIWVCVAINIWCVIRSIKQLKEWEKRLRDAEAVYSSAMELKRSYERRIKELLTNKEETAYNIPK